MDIPAVSISLSQTNLKQNVSLTLTKKTMEMQEQSTLALVQMVNSAAPHPTLGGKIDISI